MSMKISSVLFINLYHNYLHVLAYSFILNLPFAIFICFINICTKVKYIDN